MDAPTLLGRNVARLRTSRGLSQFQLAKDLGSKKTGITQGYVSELEAGKKNPTLTTMEALAEALGVHVAELLKNE